MPATDEQLLALRAQIDALLTPPAPPYTPPVFDPPAIAQPRIPDDVPWTSGPRLLSPTAKSFAARQLRLEDGGLAFSLRQRLTHTDGTPIIDPKTGQPVEPYSYDEMVFEDIETRRYALLLRLYGVGAIRNLTMRRVRSLDGTYASGRGMGLFSSSNTWLTDALFEDLTYIGSQPCTSSGDIPAVIALQGKDPNDGGERITIRRFHFENMIAQYTGYLNADPISVERGYRNVLVEDGFIRNVSDAGIDFKAADSRIHNVRVELARESFKLWSPGVHGALFSADPEVAHVMIMGNATNLPPDKPVVIEHLACRSSERPVAPLVRCENAPTTLIIKSHNLEGWGGGVPPVQILGAAAGSKVIWEQGEPS